MTNWVSASGTPFGADYFGVSPDIITTAKGITNGTIPMGAVFVKSKIYDAFMAGPEEARVVRADKSGEPVVTDGPYAEAKEFLAGYWIVDCDSRDRAYELAARASAAPGKGGVPLNMPIEVRQVMSAPPADM